MLQTIVNGRMITVYVEDLIAHQAIQLPNAELKMFIHMNVPG
jgi:hypothetical protein